MTGHKSGTGLSNSRPVDERPAAKTRGNGQARPVADIVARLFAISLDKDQNIKPASLTKTDFKTIVNSQSAGELDAELAKTVTAAAGKSDPQLSALAQLMVAACKCRNDVARHALTAFCVRVTSALWINKHWETHDLFEDILHRDKGLDASPLHSLRNVITALYSKRVEHVKGLTSIPPVASGDTSNDAGTPPSLTSAELNRQRDNVLLVGGLWLLTKGTCDPAQAIPFLAELLEQRRSRSRSNRDVALYLSEQCADQGSALADTLDYFKQRANERAALGAHLKSALEQSEQEAERLKVHLAEYKRTNDERAHRITLLEAEIARLEQSRQEQQLDERAKRTHLRDSTGQVKARAFNLLTEDVLEPLKLSLSALQREKPKTEVAAHHIELAVETIERDIKWFIE
ncbi:hypothetical protein [Stutzerimonas kunmingensis]|uniref:hypothetical protein n=1 Tax=Stutzerimonas kunmingensis TaxID=1211807 RepID=UPI0028B23675|nr:hypothetical protein [Stutzerimonas kunmingensis]